MNKNDIKQYLKRLQEIDEQLNSNELDADIFNEIDEIIKSIDVGIKETTTVSAQFTLPVKIKKIHHDAVVPEYAKHGDAGLDFRATRIIDENDDQITYGTDLSLEIPYGYVGLIFPRSSIRKYNLNLSNSIGVIDSGYRGEIMFTFNKTKGKSSKIYNITDRIGQMIILPFPYIKLVLSDTLSNSERSDGAFGHTGE